jgi:hypothetical protein
MQPADRDSSDNIKQHTDHARPLVHAFCTNTQTTIITGSHPKSRLVNLGVRRRRSRNSARHEFMFLAVTCVVFQRNCILLYVHLPAEQRVCLCAQFPAATKHRASTSTTPIFHRVIHAVCCQRLVPIAWEESRTCQQAATPTVHYITAHKLTCSRASNAVRISDGAPLTGQGGDHTQVSCGGQQQEALVGALSLRITRHITTLFVPTCRNSKWLRAWPMTRSGARPAACC